MTSGFELMQRHLGKAGTLELKCEDGSVDKINIGLLPVKLIPEFFSLFENFSNMDGDDTGTFFKAFNKEALATLTVLMKETLKESYGDVDDSILDKFIAANFFELMNKIFEVNMPTPTDDTRIKKKLSDLRKKKSKK